MKLEELEQIEATVISDRKMLTKVISTCMDDMENIGSWFYLLVYSVEYFFNMIHTLEECVYLCTKYNWVDCIEISIAKNVKMLKSKN